MDIHQQDILRKVDRTIDEAIDLILYRGILKDPVDIMKERPQLREAIRIKAAILTGPIKPDPKQV